MLLADYAALRHPGCNKDPIAFNRDVTSLLLGSPDWHRVQSHTSISPLVHPTGTDRKAEFDMRDCHQRAVYTTIATTHASNRTQAGGTTLGAGREQRIEGDGVGLAVVAVHLVQELQRKLPPASLLTGADEAAVGDHVALAAAPDHVLEDPQRLLYLQPPCHPLITHPKTCCSESKNAVSLELIAVPPGHPSIIPPLITSVPFTCHRFCAVDAVM